MAKSPESSSPKPTASQLEVRDPFADELARRIGSIVGKGQQAQVVAQVTSLVREESFRGPIAHPKHLREYEEILPGSAERIVGMAETQLLHDRELEAIALQADIEDMRAGRRYGFGGLIVIIAAAMACVWMDNTPAAVAVLSVGVIGTIGILIKGKNAGNGQK